jgi:3-mercaptopyruvate sulfurtransferase SseA
VTAVYGHVDVRSPEEYRGERLAPDHLPNESRAEYPTAVDRSTE